MERIDGGTLDAWMRERQPSQVEAVRVMTAVAEAVQYAHQQLVVHADLKPSNILVDDNGEPSLVDFGISSLALPEQGDEPGVRPRTPALCQSGTPGRPDSDAGRRYLCARPAAARLADPSLAGRRRQDAAGRRSGPPSSTGPPPRQPEARYATAQAFADDLKASQPTARSRRGRLAGATRRGCSSGRHPLSVAAAAAGCLTRDLVYLYVRAETRFTEVRQLAGYMLGEQYDALERLPGASALRARTAGVGRDYLERLAKVPGASPDLARDVAIGYGRVGHALATTSTNATGDTEAGEKALAASEKGLRDLMTRYPERDDIKRELALT
ncbi:MAG: protein kinase [Asticcacaulis sp.]